MEGLPHRGLFSNGGSSIQMAGKSTVSEIQVLILRRYGNGGRVHKSCIWAERGSSIPGGPSFSLAISEISNIVI